jgi:hypothetical protein
MGEIGKKNYWRYMLNKRWKTERNRDNYNSFKINQKPGKRSLRDNRGISYHQERHLKALKEQLHLLLKLVNKAMNRIQSHQKAQLKSDLKLYRLMNSYLRLQVLRKLYYGW